MKNCPECNSQKIITDAKAIDRGDHNSTNDMRVSVDEKPDALIFKQRNYSTVKAHICAGCGFIQLYAEDPKTLWLAYQSQRNNI